ncbi:hypothetical protein ACHAWF_018832, partial [Thalassiosira exigua]
MVSRAKTVSIENQLRQRARTRALRPIPGVVRAARRLRIRGAQVPGSPRKEEPSRSFSRFPRVARASPPRTPLDIISRQLPLSLLKASTSLPLLVELKSGTTYNGRLASCDAYMNLNLRDVVCTSKDGDRFWKLNECYVRGSSVKYLRLPEEAADRVTEEEGRWQGSGGRGGRGRGGGRG